MRAQVMELTGGPGLRVWGTKTAGRGIFDETDESSDPDETRSARLTSVGDQSGGEEELVTTGETETAAVDKAIELVRSSRTGNAELRRELEQSHRTLALKKVTSTLSRAEQADLDFVRWRLNQLRSEELAPDLERLGALADLFERYAEKAKDFENDVQRAAAVRRRWH